MRQRVVSSQKNCLICQNCFEHENLLFGHFMIDPFYDFNDFFSSVKKSRNWAVNFVGVGRIVKTNELCNLSAIRDMNSKLKMVSLKSTAFLESNLEISRYSFTQYDTLQRCHDWYYQSGAWRCGRAKDVFEAPLLLLRELLLLQALL